MARQCPTQWKWWFLGSFACSSLCAWHLSGDSSMATLSPGPTSYPTKLLVPARHWEAACNDHTLWSWRECEGGPWGSDRPSGSIAKWSGRAWWKALYWICSFAPNRCLYSTVRSSFFLSLFLQLADESIHYCRSVYLSHWKNFSWDFENFHWESNKFKALQCQFSNHTSLDWFELKPYYTVRV